MKSRSKATLILGLASVGIVSLYHPTANIKQ